MIKKNPGGRPSKLSENFIKAITKVLSDKENVLYLTDADLWFLINEELAEDERICYATFKNFKSSSNKLLIDNSELTIEEQEKAILIQKFLALYKKASIEQKKGLLKKIQDSNNHNWQKDAWIGERKFDELNLRNKNENINLGEGEKEKADFYKNLKNKVDNMSNKEIDDVILNVINK